MEGECSTDPALSNDYTSWLAKRISKFKEFPTSVVNLLGFGNSLVAASKIDKESIILEIPDSAFLSLAQVSESRFFKSLFLGSGHYLKPKQIFSAFLQVEKQKGSKSEFFPYLQAIPGSYSNIGLNNEEVNEFNRRETFERFRARLQSAENQYLQTMNFIKEIEKKDENAKSFPEVFEALKNFTLDDYKSNLATIESRSLYYKNFADPKSEVGALIPYYDCCNHSFLKIDIFKYFYFDEGKKV